MVGLNGSKSRTSALMLERCQRKLGSLVALAVSAGR